MRLKADAKKELWMTTGGFCQNPKCNTSLIKIIASKKRVLVDEFAHIIPQSCQGPRKKEARRGVNIDSAENIVMLCPTCHAIVDKSPQKYSKTVLCGWKKIHANKIKKLFKASFCGSLAELKYKVSGLLDLNKVIYDQYGPHSKAAAHPISDAAKVWRKHILLDLIPNNKKILALLDANNSLLRKRPFLLMVERFRLHANAFEFNHISSDKNPEAPLFPREMISFLKD